MLRKVLALMVATSMVVSMTACGGAKKTENEAPVEVQEEKVDEAEVEEVAEEVTVEEVNVEETVETQVGSEEWFTEQAQYKIDNLVKMYNFSVETNNILDGSRDADIALVYTLSSYLQWYGLENAENIVTTDGIDLTKEEKLLPFWFGAASSFANEVINNNKNPEELMNYAINNGSYEEFNKVFDNAIKETNDYGHCFSLFYSAVGEGYLNGGNIEYVVEEFDSAEKFGFKNSTLTPGNLLPYRVKVVCGDNASMSMIFTDEGNLYTLIDDRFYVDGDPDTSVDNLEVHISEFGHMGNPYEG